MKRPSKPASSPIGSNSFSAFQTSPKEATPVLPRLGTLAKQPRKLRILPVDTQVCSLPVVLLRPNSPVYAGQDSEMEAMLRDIEEGERSMLFARSQSESRTDKQAKLRQIRVQRKSMEALKASRKSVEPKRYSEDIKRLVHTPAFGLRSGHYHRAKGNKRTPASTTNFPYVAKEAGAGQAVIARKLESLEALQHSRSNKSRLIVS